MVCSSLDPISLGLSGLPRHPGSLFLTPHWGSFPSLFVQISFHFLLFLFSFWHPYNLDVRAFKVVPEVPKKSLSSYLFIFREKRRGVERKGEKHRCEKDTLIGCLSHAAIWGPRHVPWLGIKTVTFRFAGQCPTHRASPVRAFSIIYVETLITLSFRSAVFEKLYCLD